MASCAICGTLKRERFKKKVMVNFYKMKGPVEKGVSDDLRLKSKLLLFS